MTQPEKTKTQLTKDAPSSDAPVEEWKDWALRLCRRVEAQERDKAILRKKMRPRMLQLRELDAAVKQRNHRIKELEPYEAAGLCELLVLWWHRADNRS